jgi:hypothetical protein
MDNEETLNEKDFPYQCHKTGNPNGISLCEVLIMKHNSKRKIVTCSRAISKTSLAGRLQVKIQTYQTTQTLSL